MKPERKSLSGRRKISRATRLKKWVRDSWLFRLTVEQVTDLTSAPVYANTFAYDAVGNRTTLTSTLAANQPATNPYAYDAADQMLSENGVMKRVELPATVAVAESKP